MAKVTPCPHPKPKGRKVCDACKEAREKARRSLYYYTVVRPKRVKKG